MRQTIRHLTLFLAALLALAAPAGASFESPGGETAPLCRVFEAGKPGPRDDYLGIAGTKSLSIRRDGLEIQVLATAGSEAKEEQCAGPAATVNSVDRIFYRPRRSGHLFTVDEREGLFGGALGEVEIRVGRPLEALSWLTVRVYGTPSYDEIRIGRTPRGITGVNLNFRNDAWGEDLELFVVPARAHLHIDGGPGNDWLDAEGIAARFVGPILRNGTVLRGGEDHDRIDGTPQRDRLEGGDGEDELFGGPGDDLLDGGPGRDLLRCGPGLDQAYVDSFDVWDRGRCEKPHRSGSPR